MEQPTRERSTAKRPKASLKTHSWFLPLKRSPNRKFRAVQKSRVSRAWAALTPPADRRKWVRLNGDGNGRPTP